MTENGIWAGSPGLSTSRARLRVWRDGDEAHLYRWHADPEQMYLWNQDREIPTYERFVRRFTRRMKNRMDHFFILEQVPSADPVGFVFTYGADAVDRNAWFCIVLAPEAKGKGVGLDGAMLFLRHLFLQLGYRKVYAEIYGFNERALGLIREAGFVREGRLTGHRWWNGAFWDLFIYSMGAPGFEEFMKAYGQNHG